MDTFKSFFRQPLHKLDRFYFRWFAKDVPADPDPMIFACGVSRSGTTLLSAILDAHSQICMGYEMSFPPLSGIDFILDRLGEVEGGARDLRQAGSLLRKNQHKAVGKWISRVHRLGLDVADLYDVLRNHREKYGNSLLGKGQRLKLIKAVLDLSKKKTHAVITGFKITETGFYDYLSLFPNAYFIYILRDPRDVFASLKSAGFNVKIGKAISNWISGIESFEQFQKEHPERCTLIRYEDLVTHPLGEIEPLFQRMKIPLESCVLHFHESDAKILTSSHPNAPNIKKGFFASSIGRYGTGLSEIEIQEIEKSCRTKMRTYNYLQG
jgi:uncharacterized protein (UPF0335 family)